MGKNVSFFANTIPSSDIILYNEYNQMARALPRALAIEKRQKYYRLHWSCHNRSGLGGPVYIFETGTTAIP